MTREIAGMAVVASGTSAQVQRWSALLRDASIQFAVTQSCGDDGSPQYDNAEVWVERADLDEARSAIGAGGERSLLK